MSALTPSLHPVSSIGVHPYASHISQPTPEFIQSIKDNPSHPPIHLVENLCFDGVEYLFAYKALGIELIQGIVHVIEPAEVLKWVSRKTFLSRKHSVYDMYRLVKIAREEFKCKRNLDIAKCLGIYPSRVSKLTRLDNLTEEQLEKAEDQKIGSELAYYIASAPKAQRDELIANGKQTNAKVTIGTFSTPRVNVTKKHGKPAHYSVSSTNEGKLDFYLPKQCTPDQASAFCKLVGDLFNKYIAEGYTDFKEIVTAINLFLRHRPDRGNKHAA